MLLSTGAVPAAAAAAAMSREFSGSTANANMLIKCWRRKRREETQENGRDFLR